jgi:twitching motility protein PilT
MIGEMRDGISFSAAMSAADTGHLVLSTLHTTNAAQSGGSHPGFLQIGRARPGSAPAGRDPAGGGLSADGHTIEGGRHAGARNHDQHRHRQGNLIEENRLDKLHAAIETGVDDGMQNFNQALYNLVKERKITEKEALAKATNPQALEMNFKGIFLDEARRILT